MISLKKLLLFLFLIPFSNLGAQHVSFDTHWAFQSEGDSEQLFRTGARTLEGGVMMAGFTRSRTGKREDGWIVKLNEEGQQEWEYVNGGSGNDGFYDILATSDNAFLAAGNTLLDDQNKGWLVKVDSDGRKLWERSFSAGISNYLRKVIETRDGGYLAVGETYFISKEDFDGWVIKVSQGGELEWERTISEGGTDLLSDVVQLSDGTYAVAGASKDSESGIFRGSLVRLNAQGQPVQKKVFQRSGDLVIYGLTYTFDGGLALIGSANEAQEDNTAGWLAKLDKNWNTQWEKRYGYQRIKNLKEIQPTPDGGYLLVGTKNIKQTDDFDEWVLKLDRQWRIVWDHTFSFAQVDQINDLISVRENEYVFVGSSQVAGSTQHLGWGMRLEVISPQMKIEQFVYEKIEEWKQRGEYETTNDFLTRVTEENRLIKAKEYEQLMLKQLKNELRQNIYGEEFKLGRYDPDNQSYLITYQDNEFVLPMPIGEAPTFKGIFGSAVFGNIDFILNGEYLRISHFEIQHPSLSKTYVWDYTMDYPYEPTEIIYNFGGLPGLADNNNSNPGRAARVRVDSEIPETGRQKPNTFALIIGNEDYRSFQPGLDFEANVQFAVNDATIFREYCIKTLGIPARNITLLTDATLAQMTTAIDRLIKLAEVSNGEAELIFYYAGHGFPDQQTKEAYIMPVDVSGANVQIAIKLRDLYAKLAQHPTQKVTVFLDACFSGAGRGAGLLASRGVRIRPKNDLVKGNMVVFTSSSGEESSGPYYDKRHGLFTYFLLEKLNTTQGNLTYADLADYLSGTVPRESILINNQRQNPSIIVGSAVKEEWKQWEF
jgi:hypothetical protein